MLLFIFKVPKEMQTFCFAIQVQHINEQERNKNRKLWKSKYKQASLEQLILLQTGSTRVNNSKQDVAQIRIPPSCSQFHSWNWVQGNQFLQPIPRHVAREPAAGYSRCPPPKVHCPKSGAWEYGLAHNS